MADLMSMIAGARSTATEVSVVQAADALNRGEVRVVVDVREPGEFREEHIPDAVNIPRGLLELRADPASPVADPTLSEGQADRILVYCAKGPGARSLLAAQTLTTMGYERVEVLGGGLLAWNEAGLPVDRADVPAALKLGDVAPDFEARTTEGPVRFHEWIGDSWAVLFSHPKDFTPVCTTELGYMAKIKPEFDRRNVKVIGLSVDPVDKHSTWAADIEETQGSAPNYPIIGDDDYNVSKLYGMLPANANGSAADRTAADNQTVRNVFVIGPDKKVKLVLVYPMTTGRNFDEVLRVIDSLQLTANHRVATPVNWHAGDDVIIAGSVSNEEAEQIFGEWESPKPYIRIVPEPVS
jgi:alkyl hydroperoxide reductase subunit AhpC/rhodanese-related sulfurtransferase